MQEQQLIQDLESSQYVFLVVNPLSGGRAAGQLLSLGFNYLQYTRQDNNDQVKLFIGDIRTGPSGQKSLFQIIKAVAHRKRDLGCRHSVRIVVAGGDGTVSWVFSELEAHQVDAQSVVVGVLPFGTGNDFANATGTNTHVLRFPQEDSVTQMRRLCETWMEMCVRPFDLWEVSVQLQEGGTLKKVDGSTKQKVILNHPAEKPFKLPMLNYFSFGVESRIGLGFDRNRTNNPYLNRGAYAMEGFKKFAFHRTQFIDNLIEGLHFKSDIKADHIFRCRPLLSKTERLAALITTRDKATDDNSLLQSGPRSPFSSPAEVSRAVSLDADFDHAPEHAYLKPCVSLLFLNIPSFAGGLDPWTAAEGKLGVRLPRHKSAEVHETMLRCCRDCAIQDFGDGKIEVIGFQSLVELSLTNLERILPAHIAPGGWRIFQGGGHFRLPFRKDLPADYRVYFQVDGEYFLAQLISSVELRPLRKVNVLGAPKRSTVQTR